MSIVYPNSTNQLSLTPQSISLAHFNVENKLQRLGNEMDLLIRDKAAKVEKLQYYPEESVVKRNLFAWFFTKSDKLRVIQILQKRVEARKIEM